ncbi:MAG TPA: GNAT family N-acetyltransferase [Candidatus Limnocylindria bacterium]|nr:GNAT family N-acetyltransferase [Candidatus Limnocylindria bacterium]
MTAAHLDAAAEILAARQRRLRHGRPELPEAYTTAEACGPVLAALLERPGAHGVYASQAGQNAGYFIGYPRTEPIWGRACWSPMEGSALADGVGAETIRDLYAAWAEDFVRSGYFLHYAHASPDEPELMAAWMRTGFGQMQAYAVREVGMPAAEEAKGVTIRRAAPADIDRLEPLLPLIAQALMRPPAYAISLPEDIPTYRDSWLEELSGSEGRHWLAEEDDRALAMASFYPAEPDPMVPDGAWYLALAMTLPEARGRGLMRALLATGFDEARSQGVTHCVTDWRTASLPTHRSWTALGFRPTHYRLHRHIDERIAWAAPR